jgi:hypothetical protein
MVELCLLFPMNLHGVMRNYLNYRRNFTFYVIFDHNRVCSQDGCMNTGTPLIYYHSVKSQFVKIKEIVILEKKHS